MAESRTNGGGSQGTLSVHPAQAAGDEVTTHDSSDGGAGAPTTKAVGGLKKGDALGRYLVLEQLGAGAMGVVYAAYDPELDRKIAIKILRPQEGKGDRARRQERLVREAKAMAKLSHPNVGAIYDVGVHRDQVFLAMEFLSGGTLRDWIAAKRRPWREIVKMFIEVGKGLAGAHAEGLIHRDFKPDNVLLDKNGVPKVVDFGLVRLTSAALDRTTSGSMDAVALEETDAGGAAPLSMAQTALADLTRTGALTGTPAYMAPEQFLGKEIDARTDQFAFCIALYEALYGERPFAGETVIGLADAVTSEIVRPIPKTSDIPAWVRRCLTRGLRKDPEQRFPGFDELLAALANDPVARLRRRIVLTAACAAAITGGLVLYQTTISNRREVQRQVVEHVGVADAALAEADAKRTEARSLRERAFAAFDSYQRDKGEELWAESLADAKAADAGYLRGIQQLEAAVTLTSRRDLKQRIADALAAYIQMEDRTLAERSASLRQLAPYDDGGVRIHKLSAPGRFQIDTVPAGLTARIETYDHVNYRVSTPARQVGKTPLDLTLEPGSYRVTFDGTNETVGFHYPFLLGPGERRSVSVRVPPASAVPRDFVYVPEGRSLFGSANEEMRTSFLEATPIHEVSTNAFLVSRFETRIAEWIEFLNALPREERAKRRPRGAAMQSGGSVELKQNDATGHWEISLRPTNTWYHAAEGEALRYQDRLKLAAQDWTRFPVAGISAEDAIAFATWLDASGRVPQARLCSELEWERTARGADGREFPHGSELHPEDANFDLTYGRKNAAYGPDEVGRHPASLSPFGAYDLAGNVWEITRSALDRNQFVARGGSFYQYRPAQWIPNRQPVAAVSRDHTMGLRICADVRF